MLEGVVRCEVYVNFKVNRLQKSSRGNQVVSALFCEGGEL